MSTTELDNQSVWWEVRGEYEYWCVYERHAGDTASYDREPFRIKKEANKVAAMLNDAYRRGQQEGYERACKDAGKAFDSISSFMMSLCLASLRRCLY